MKTNNNNNHVQNYLLPDENAPQNTRRNSGSGWLLLGFFALTMIDGMVIRHLDLNFGEALLILGLAICSTAWGCCAAVTFRLGGGR